MFLGKPEQQSCSIIYSLLFASHCPYKEPSANNRGTSSLCNQTSCRNQHLWPPVQGLSTPLHSFPTDFLNPQALPLLPEVGAQVLRVQVTSVPAFFWEMKSPGEVGPLYSQNTNPGLKALVEAWEATVFIQLLARISHLEHQNSSPCVSLFLHGHPSSHTPQFTLHQQLEAFFFQCRRNEVCDLAKTLPRLNSVGIKPKLLQTWLLGPASTGSLASIYLPDTSQGFFSLGPSLCPRPLRAGPLQDLQQLRRPLPKEAFPATSTPPTGRSGDFRALTRRGTLLFPADDTSPRAPAASSENVSPPPPPAQVRRVPRDAGSLVPCPARATRSASERMNEGAALVAAGGPRVRPVRRLDRRRARAGNRSRLPPTPGPAAAGASRRRALPGHSPWWPGLRRPRPPSSERRARWSRGRKASAGAGRG